MQFLVEIEKLKKHILSLSALVEQSLADAMTAFDAADKVLAAKVKQKDEIIDQMEIDIEEECLKTLALHQPVARDLRLVVAVLKMNNDLERIGDLAVNIAERAELLNGRSLNVPGLNLGPMAEVVKKMLKMSLDAFCRLDIQMALDVCSSDDAVDSFNRDTIEKIGRAIEADPAGDKINSLILIMGVSRSLERIADHATNIAEDLIYLIEGRIVRHSAGRNGQIRQV